MSEPREIDMFLYLVGVSFISIALGACFAFVGGLIVLTFLVLFSSCALVVFCSSSNLSVLSTIAVCSASIVFLNLGWFGAVIFANLRGLIVFLREQLLLKTGKL